MNAPHDIAAYTRVTALLDPYVAGILAGQYREPDVGSTMIPLLSVPISSGVWRKSAIHRLVSPNKKIFLSSPTTSRMKPLRHLNNCSAEHGNAVEAFYIQR